MSVSKKSPTPLAPAPPAVRSKDQRPSPLATDPSDAGPGSGPPPSPAVLTDGDLHALNRRRRRIGKACDDCRRRKIKCNGAHPCSNCAEFSSPCTYTPLPRRDDHHGQVQALQQKLQAAESLLAKLLRRPPQPPATSSAPASAAETPGSVSPSSQINDRNAEEARYISLFQDFSQLNLVENGETDFYGVSSSAAFLSRITQDLPELTRYDSRIPFMPNASLPPIAWTPALAGVPWQSTHDHSRLPSRETARMLCEYAFNCGSCLLRTIHVPSFFDMFERLYQNRPSIYTSTERRFVGLLFSIIALGSMYDVDENDPTNPDHYDEAIEKGYKYYISARMFLQDFTECRDITTLQAIVFVIQFLQSTGNLGGCYTLVGVALRSALRMGLHRDLPSGSLNPIETETRRRLFYTIRQMDVYLSTTLGLPILLQDKDIDQKLPTEVDDEYITETGILQTPPGSSSFFEAFNAHTRLMKILAKVLEHVYPQQSAGGDISNGSYTINYTNIREIEHELHNWQSQLSPSWHPGQEDDDQRERVKILLRFAFAHVQMMLYRPFLHHFPHQKLGTETTDERVYALAAAGIHVCRNIVHIGLEINKRATLMGPYWFNTYTQFSAVLCLVVYILNNPQAPSVTEILADAQHGKDSISSFTQKSLAADKITAALDALFKQLPSRMSLHGSPANPPDVPSQWHKAQSLTNATRFQEQTPLTSPYTQGQQWQSGEVPPTAAGLTTQRPVTLGIAQGGSKLTDSAPSPMPVHDHNLIFPNEDPFAYPLPLISTSLMGGGGDQLPLLTEDPMQDIMQFPIYDAYGDMGNVFESEAHFPFAPPDQSFTTFSADGEGDQPGEAFRGS